jgi:malonyl-ACP decarboxylase
MRGRKKVWVSGMGAVTSVSKDISALVDALKNGHTDFKIKKLFSGNYTSAAEISGWTLETALSKFELDKKFLLKIKKLIGREPMQIQTAVIATLEALVNAGLLLKSESLFSMGIVIAGSNFQKYPLSADSVPPKHALQFFDTYLMSLISSLFEIKGEGFSVGAASASGNMALIQAKRLLESGYLKKVLVVTPFFDFSELDYASFEMLGAMLIKTSDQFDAQKVCRPFDKEHSGFVYGQSCGAILLESDPKNINNKNNIVISGGGITLDGNHTSEPNVNGEVQSMKQALMNAKLKSTQIDYINSHGTGSVLGDETELSALKEVFSIDSNLCINATKSILGHGLTSAGLVESIVTVLQMQNNFLHPSLNLDHPIDNQFKWVKSNQAFNIKHALKNSFGFGGINTSLVFSKV